MFGLFKLTAGDQLYVLPLNAFNVKENPGHTHPGLGPAFASGSGIVET